MCFEMHCIHREYGALLKRNQNLLFETNDGMNAPLLVVTQSTA